MGLALVILLFAVGIVLVVKGGDIFVDAASWIAAVSGIPKILIGATIVSVATTLPEMLVSVMAASRGEVDMSIGNAVGSVTANIGLIMALALLFMPGAIKRKDYSLKFLLMTAAAVIIVACGFFGHISIGLSFVLLLVFAVFMTDNVIQAKKNLDRQEDADGKETVTGRIVAINMFKFVFGAACIAYGANLMVDKGSALARLVGVSERIIGVTIIAVGTSLPELITTITAIRKKQAELSAGNILGANIMDLSLIMPLSSLIAGKPLPVSAMSGMIDLPACLVMCLVAAVPTMITAKFSRWQGALMLLLYTGYLAITCTM